MEKQGPANFGLTLLCLYNILQDTIQNVAPSNNTSNLPYHPDEGEIRWIVTNIILFPQKPA
jgi:hypothetical protein